MHGKPWTQAEIALLTKEYSNSNSLDLAKRMDRTLHSVRSMARDLNLKKPPKCFSQSEQIEFIRLFPNTSNKELATIFKITIKAVKSRALKYELKKSPEYFQKQRENTQFKPGQVPLNKGKKMSADVYERVKHTFFKKGHIPHNTVAIGTEVKTTKGGYVKVKVAEPNFWKYKQRIVWEETFGPIPKGFLVQFKNKNIYDFSPDNLYLIKRQNQMTENSFLRYPKDIRQSIKILNKLKKTIRNYEKAN